MNYLIVSAAVVACIMSAYHIGVKNGQADYEAEYSRLRHERDLAIAEIETQNAIYTNQILLDTQKEIENAKDETSRTIDALVDRYGVPNECQPVPETDTPTSRADETRAEHIRLNTRRVEDAARQCRETEIRLEKLQKWARAALVVCDGGDR